MILDYFRWVTFHQKSGSKFVKNNIEIIGLSLDSGISIEEAIAEFIEINYNLEEIA